MTEWKTIMLVLCLLLMVFLLWKEWTRSQRAFLLLRLIATVIAVLSLYLLAYPLYYSTKARHKGNELVLLTDGYAEDSVRKLRGSERMPRYVLKNTGMDEVLDKHKGRNTIHVFGYGLEADQMDKLRGQEVKFHAAAEPVGFTSVQYRNALVRGEPFEVEGIFHGRDTAGVTILLTGFGTVLDSARIGEHHDFRLSYVPPQIGIGNFSLIALWGKDTLDKQLLALEVSEDRPLNLLFLESAPGFENRFLRDWLSAKGYRVTSRTRVSKDIYSRQFVNEDRKGIDRVDPAMLAVMDCLVTDDAALAALSAAELKAIQVAVRENGMGLLISTAGERTNASKLFRFRQDKMPGSVQQKLELTSGKGRTLSTLHTEDQFVIELDQRMQPLVRDKAARTFATVSRQGRGSIVLNTINYSYKWILAGAAADYDSFWWTLINKTLGNVTNETWTVSPQRAIINQPITLTLETEAAAPVGEVEGEKVYLKNDPLFPTQWEGRFWPRTSGWKEIRNKDGSKTEMYVYDEQAWLPMRMSQRIRETMAFVAGMPPGNEVLVQPERRDRRPIPPILSLLLFMAAAGFLWYEQKRMSG